MPFFLTQTGALVEGTGERVTAIGALPPWHVLVIKPPVATSTGDAYAQLDRCERATRTRSTSVTLRALEALQRGDFAAVEACLSNDFHNLAVRSTSAVACAIEALYAAGATNAMLSGSGSAVFTLTADAAALTAIAERIDLPTEYLQIATHFKLAPTWRGMHA